MIATTRRVAAGTVIVASELKLDRRLLLEEGQLRGPCYNPRVASTASKDAGLYTNAAGPYSYLIYALVSPKEQTIIDSIIPRFPT